MRAGGLNKTKQALSYSSQFIARVIIDIESLIDLPRSVVEFDAGLQSLLIDKVARHMILKHFSPLSNAITNSS